MDLKNYLWTLPFISFLLGYQFLSFFTVANNFPNPSIIGSPLTQAIKALSDNNLNPRIMAEKEEPDLPEGTVLSQTPAAGQRVKPNQPVFLVVARKPKKIPAPSLLNKTADETLLTLHHLNLRSKTYALNAPAPKDTCIGQIPDAKEPVEGKKMTLYISAGKNPLMLFPNLKGAAMSDVQNCLSSYNFTTKILHTNPIEEGHQCTLCTVIDQKPLPGSIIDVRRPVYVQLQVQ
jgi:beta-lactam-binding protein with PASTA domain